MFVSDLWMSVKNFFMHCKCCCIYSIAVMMKNFKVKIQTSCVRLLSCVLKNEYLVIQTVQNDKFAKQFTAFLYIYMTVIKLKFLLTTDFII